MSIGLDRKLKADVPGQILRITVTPPLAQSKRVRLSLTASAQGSSVLECNGQIATALTVFDLLALDVTLTLRHSVVLVELPL